MNDKAKAKVEDRLLRLTDRFLDIGTKVVDRGADYVEDAITSHELVLSVESLIHMLDVIEKLVTPWAQNKFHTEGKFLHFVTKNLTQYVKILKSANTANPVVDNLRDEIGRELTNIAIEVRSILMAKPSRKLWEKRLSDKEVDDYQATMVQQMTPKLIARLLSYIDEEKRVLEVVAQMKQKERKTDTEVKNP